MIKEYIIEDTESPAVFMHFSTIKVWVNGTELTKGWVEGVDETSDTSHAIGSSTTPPLQKPMPTGMWRTPIIPTANSASTLTG